MDRIDLQTPDWELFYGQFFLTRERPEAGERWHVFRFDSWRLYVHRTLPVCRITDSNGVPVGVLLGHAIDLEGMVSGNDLKLPVDASDTDAVERCLYTLGGRWACLLWTPHQKRFYLDPFGSLAAVYAPGPGILAATTTIINVLQGAHSRNLARPVYKYTRSGFQYGDLTPFEHIRRLLPNHYLDIMRFASVRHHYRSLRPSRLLMQERNPLTARISTQVQGLVSAIARRHPLICTLTGGRDTRLLAACCKPFLDRTTFVTFRWDRPARNVPIDQEFPGILASRFGLRHQYLHAPAIDDYTDQFYQMRIGFSTTSGQAPNFYSAVRHHVAPGSAMLTGFGGYARDHFWSKFEQIRQPANPKSMVQTFNGKHLATPRNVNAMEQLMSDISWEDPHDLIDVLYLEQRVGSWSSPMMYGFAPEVVHIAPFCHRELQDLRLRYPKEAIRRTTIIVEAVNYLWPELSEVPYNRYRGLRELKRRLGRRLKKLRRYWK